MGGTQVKWLIEKDIFRENAPDEMAEIAKKKGMDVVRVQRIPFSESVAVIKHGCAKQIYSSNMPFCNGECVVVYGSLNICKQLMEPKRWTPTAWFDLERFRCVSYYAHWGKYLLNEALMMMPWGELRRQSDAVYDKFIPEGEDTRDSVSIFIKPDSNDKIFSGKVVHFLQFEKWAKQEEDCYEISPETLVLVSGALEPLDVEWRFVICDRKVVTGTIYKIAGETSPLPLSADRPAPIALAEEIAAHPWQPAPVYVLDICATQMDPAGASYKVLECGPFNGAGLYKCDLEKVVDAVSAQALKDWEAAKKQ